jgi:hypothetical protein
MQVSEMLLDCRSNYRDEREKVEASKKNESDIKVDTLMICDAFFLVTFKNNIISSIATLSNDTVFRGRDYFSEIKFIDFNFDGCQDLKAEVVSREAGECELWLFDRNVNSYRELSNVYPNPEAIKGTNYYYSYERIGCGGKKWQSSLCRLENFESKQIGIMYGDGCEDVDSIFVNRLDENGDEKLFFEKHTHIFRSGNDKSDFIKNYWVSNCSAFK